MSGPEVPRTVQALGTGPVGEDVGAGQSEGLPLGLAVALPVVVPVGLPPVVPVAVGLPVDVGEPVEEEVLVAVAVAVAVDVCCWSCATPAPIGRAELPLADADGDAIGVGVPEGVTPGCVVLVGQGSAPSCAVEMGTFRINMPNEQIAMIVSATRASDFDECTGSTPSSWQPIRRDGSGCSNLLSFLRPYPGPPRGQT